MSHALLNYDGLCRNIHGHSYKLLVTIIGEPADLPGDPKDGMVIDFKELKDLVKEHVVDRLDHSLVINRQAHVEKLRELGEMYDTAT
jgi:6-pyruvoyltetrahydropterin/6-carboxytetrahydropterin synthase